MKQEKIWEYFQSDPERARELFSRARPMYLSKFLKSGLIVLNIGVGAGVLEEICLSKKVDIYALDPSESTIANLRNRLGLHEKARAGYAQNIPFQDKFFDMVVMSEVLEHLDDQTLRRSLKEVRRVLRDDGRFFISVPFNEQLIGGLVICPNCGSDFHRFGHVRSFDKKEIEATLLGGGFLIDEMWVDTFVDWSRKGSLNFIKSMVRRLLGRIGSAIADPHILVIARKGAAGN